MLTALVHLLVITPLLLYAAYSVLSNKQTKNTGRIVILASVLIILVHIDELVDKIRKIINGGSIPYNAGYIILAIAVLSFLIGVFTLNKD